MLIGTSIKHPIFRQHHLVNSLEVLAGFGCLALIFGLLWLLLTAVP